MLKSKFVRIAIFLLMSISTYQLGAQSNTLFFMDGIHQSTYLNPAFQSNCNGFLALPGISGISVDGTNTGFAYKDLIHLGTGAYRDSLIIDIEGVKSKLGKSNSFMVATQIPLLGLGFWIRNSYFTFSITNKSRVRISYPDDLVKLVDGNANYIGNNNPLTIEGFGPNGYNYNEFAFGLSKQINHRLVIGGKFKFLAGNVSLETRKSSIKLYTAEAADAYAMRLVTDLRLNISAPLNFTYDNEGMISDVEFDDSNVAGNFFSTKNKGVAIDFGASYQFNDELKLYASVIDLGFIRWKSNTTNLSQSGTFEFSGFTLDSAWTDSDYDEAEALGDSLQDFFKFTETDTKYTTFLNTGIYLGATYEIAPFMNFGLLSKTWFYNRKAHLAFTLSANLKPTKWFTTSLSYSVMNREYKNIGFGAAVKLGPVQLYLLTDNLNFAFSPKNTRSASLQLGLNLYFGCGKRDNYSMIKDRKPGKSVDFM